MINSAKLSLAAAIATALLWGVCSALVAIAPEPAMTVTGHMLHLDTTNWQWSMTWGGFFTGLIGWVVSAALFVWITAALYNRLHKA